MYHVVFFDKEVSRTWVNAVSIRNFSIDDDPEDMGKVCLHVACLLLESPCRKLTGPDKCLWW